MLPPPSACAALSALILGAAVVLPRAPAAQAAPDTDELRRILHVSNGPTIRAVSRFRDGRWEYRSKAGWKELPASVIASVELEREVLRTLEERRRAAAPRDLTARTSVADWALSAGLTEEGLEEITAVLGRDPDCQAALDALAAHASLVRVPSAVAAADARAAAVDALVRFGASAPTAVRELAVLELGKLPRDETLRDELLTELRSNIVTRRSFGALALRRLLPREGIQPLILHAVLDPSDDVRQVSSLALRAANEPGLILPFVRVLEKSESPLLRQNAAEALGDMGYPAAVQPLVARLATAAAPSDGTKIPHAYIFVGRQFAYVQDFDVEVAQFQAVADPNINTLIEGSVLTAGVAGVQETVIATEVASVRTALEKLTGDSPGKTSKAWLAWWETNGSRWRSEDRSRPRTGEGSASGG